jgi:hypothetical protein
MPTRHQQRLTGANWSEVRAATPQPAYGAPFNAAGHDERLNARTGLYSIVVVDIAGAAVS